MIAASSLFTSCIEQVEPAGIETLRDAKAEYLLGVKQLRLAEAEVQKAQATYWQALAAVEQANAAYRDAQTEGQKLDNEMKALLNEAQEMKNEAQAMDLEKKAAEIAAQIDSIKAAAEAAAVKAQETLAKANEDLRVALAKIAADQLKLTEAEALAVSSAISNYEKALADYLAAVAALTKAEKDLWNNEYDMATWPRGAWYEGQIEKYSELAEMFADMLESVPTDPDVEAWKAELQKYQDSLNEYNYNRYQVTKDSIDFMVNVYHDGVKAYEEAMKEASTAWNEENKAPKEVKEPIKPAKDTNRVKLPKFVVDNADAAIKIYNTYGDMLSDYKQVVPVGDTTKWGFEIVPGAGVTTVDINNVDYQLKDWILGKDQYEPITFTYKDKATDTEKTLSAHYGLKGALAILQRELVTAQAAQDTAAVKKAAADADSAWAAHRAILIAGLKEWQPYKDSLAKQAELEKAMKEAQAKYASGENSLIGAINTFGEDIIKASTPGIYSPQDSVTIYNAFTAFAAARKAYLDYEEEDPEKDLNYFHYGQNVDPGYEKVEFANLDFKGFQKNATYTNGSYALAEGTLTDWTGASTTHLAYAYVASQLFGTSMVAYVDDPVSNPYPTAIDDIITLMNDAGNYTPFYGLYMLDKKTVDGKDVLVIKVVATGEEYVPSEVKDAEDAYNNYKGVEDAEKAFVEIYNSFWGTSATVLADIVTPNGYISDEKSGYKDTKAGCYTEATFCEPYPIVNFNGADIIYNDGLAGILQMIDPKGPQTSVQGWKSGSTIKPSAIFGSNNTDFYKKLFAENQLDLLMNGGSYQKALDAIAAWIEEIEKAFDKVVSDYEEALPKYEQYKKDKKAYDDAKKAAGLTPATIGVPVNYAVAEIKDGKWDLKGAALENAEKYLPGYPEKLSEWKMAADKYNDQIYHLTTLINTLDAAYLAAVKVYENTDAPTFEKYLEEYAAAQTKYIDETTAAYNNALKQIEYYTKQLAQYNAGYDDTQLALEDAQYAVAKAEQAVADALAKLQIAEAEYNKVMAAYCPED